MITVIDIACRMMWYDKVKVMNKEDVLFHGTVRNLNKENETHRLIVKNLLPLERELIITTMN